jgi:hypothetical protein
MSRLGENAHSSETVTSSPAAAGGDKPAFSAAECPPERLEWQTELDSAMADIDHRLEHPRRRATDPGAQPALPQLGQIDLTSELLDEIAWRVAEQVRRTLADSDSPSPAKASAESAPPAPGIALTIRIRKPLFGFRFWRRRVREESVISFADSTIT